MGVRHDPEGAAAWSFPDPCVEDHPPPEQATAQRSTRPDRTGPSSNSSLIPTFRAGNDAPISDLFLQSAWRRFDGTAQKEDLGSVTSNLKFNASGTACNRVPASGPGKAAARSNFLAACCAVAWAPWGRELAGSPARQFASSPIHLGRVGSELVLFLACASIPTAPSTAGSTHQQSAPEQRASGLGNGCSLRRSRSSECHG